MSYKMARKDDYPTLSTIRKGPVEILLNGRVKDTVKSPDDAFTWLMNNQNYSVSYALKYGGYSCRALTLTPEEFEEEFNE
jgi:hypothetical protein